MGLKVANIVLFLVATIKVSGVELDQYGWCNINSDYVQYNKSQVCVQCGGVTTIKMREEMESLRCCNDGKLKIKCSKDDLSCEDGGYFPISSKCDQIKDCVDGSDEKNCTTECSSFACSNETKKDHCVDMDSICDGVKDCISGLDETNCIYSDGRCAGYLCPVSNQCISVDKVCNLSKDCLTGADEVNCKEFSTPDTFECGGSHGLHLHTICDGQKDCPREQDEDNCYMWTTWSTWSECKCLKNREATDITRNRTCVTSTLSLASVGNCTGKDKEKKKVTCDCGWEDEENSQAMIYVTIVITVVLVLAVGLIVLNMIMRQKRAWLSYTHTAISIRNHTTESLIGQSNDELSDDRPGTPPHTHFIERRLPATPPLRLHNYSSVQFGRRTSIHDNIRERYQTSILAPSETNSAQNDMVENPLYHTYRDEKNVYSRLSVVNSSENNQRSPSRNSRVNNDDDDETEHDLAIMDQIQVAQMENLLEESDFNII